MQQARIPAGVGYRKRSAGGDHLTGEALAKGDDEAVLFLMRQADADAAAENLVCLVQEEQADKRGAGNGGCLMQQHSEGPDRGPRRRRRLALPA